MSAKRLFVCASLLILPVLPGLDAGGPTPFIRGDADLSGTIDLSDAVETLTYLFLGGPGGSCPDAMDTDDNGRIDLGDPVALLSYPFLGGVAPRPPHPDLGRDPSLDPLICSTSAPPNGEGPVSPTELEPLLEDALRTATLISGGSNAGDDSGVSRGIGVTADLFDFLASLRAGDSLLDHLDVAGMGDFVALAAPEIPPPGAPLALPASLCVPAGEDGCYWIDPELLRGDSRDSGSLQSTDHLSVEVDPQVVCGPGDHVVRVTVRDGSGLESGSSTLIHLYDRLDVEGARSGESCDVDESDGPTDLPSMVCFWVWAGRENPARQHRFASQVSYFENGMVKEREDGAMVTLRDDSTELSFKDIGPGPRHTLVGARYQPRCSMPRTDYHLRTLGTVSLEVNLLCLSDGLEIQTPPCSVASVEVEGLYQGVATLAAHSGENCSKELDVIETLAQEECALHVDEAILFQKALILQRGNDIIQEVLLTLGGTLAGNAPHLAADPELTRGVSHLSVEQIGRSEGTLRALAGSEGGVPLSAELLAAGKAQITATGNTEGFSAAVTETAAIYALGFTNCPCPSRFIAIARIYGRGSHYQDARETAAAFFRTRTGWDTDWPDE